MAEHASANGNGGFIQRITGTTISKRFKVMELIAEGGFGAVFLGEDLTLRRPVAIKVLKPPSEHDSEALKAYPSLIKRFMREATAAANVQSPHVVSMYDIGIAIFQNPDLHLNFLVMEYIAGKPLGKIIHRRGKLTPSQVVSIAKQVASALESIHEIGIVHRDLKPGNIMITPRRRGEPLVQVCDFNISRMTEPLRENEEDDPATAPTALTATNALMGTFAYMSPEQFKGHVADVRSDLYALGVIMYEMLTGIPPCTGGFLTVNNYHASKQGAVPLYQHPALTPEERASIPPDLVRIIDRLLKRNPKERFQTAAETLRALEACQLLPQRPGRLILTVAALVAMSVPLAIAGFGLLRGRDAMYLPWEDPPVPIDLSVSADSEPLPEAPAPLSVGPSSDGQGRDRMHKKRKK